MLFVSSRLVYQRVLAELTTTFPDLDEKPISINRSHVESSGLTNGFARSLIFVHDLFGQVWATCFFEHVVRVKKSSIE